MTKFQMYYHEAFNKLMEKRIDQSLEEMMTVDETIVKAKFVAKMKLAKENKKKVQSSQLNAF